MKLHRAFMFFCCCWCFLCNLKIHTFRKRLLSVSNLPLSEVRTSINLLVLSIAFTSTKPTFSKSWKNRKKNTINITVQNLLQLYLRTFYMYTVGYLAFAHMYACSPNKPQSFSSAPLFITCRVNDLLGTVRVMWVQCSVITCIVLF